MLSRVMGAAKNGGTQLIEPADDDGGVGVGVVDTPDPGAVAIDKDVHEAQVTPIPENLREVGGGTTPSRHSSNHDNQFFFEDEVFRIDREGRVHFGVVTETTESYSSDDDEDTDDALGSGEVRVAFYPDGKEMIQSEQSIGLADRTLMPGDVVRRRRPGQKDLGGQAGYVRDVNVRADVKVLGSKYVLKNVPAERLRPISEWSRDAPVCFGTWIGTTANVNEVAVLRSSNGGRLEITSKDFYRFKDAHIQRALDVFNPNVYYPGNVVIGRLPTVDRIKNLTPDIPLPTNRKGRAMFTVESTRTTSIEVSWTCRAFSSMEHCADVDSLKQPKKFIKGEDLNHVKRLNIYESYMLQIHDRFYLKYSICDKLIKYADWEEQQAATYLGIFQRQLLEQNQSNMPNNSGSLANLETLPGSSSRIVRNQPKFRRLANKQSGSVRLDRRQQDENESSNISPKVTSTAPTKAQSFSNDEIWDSVDEDDYEDNITDLQEATEIPETLTGAAEDNTKQLEVTAVAASTNTDSSAQSPKISTRCVKRKNAKKKIRSVKKLLSAPFVKKAKDPKDGDELIVETLVVFSSVTVVWQDGTVETGIHSTQLYPIHHLDNHEFFPGDFVSNANENGTEQTDYGVIQSVHHDERTAKVKWFNIYSNMDNPVPFCKDTEELSVYDLKDHSDYQYRPGTMVIRVSNFTGEDANSTAGQVIENFPDGRVRVWWVKGHITMCYPQDLFEINHNDQDHDAYDSDGSEDSWETQSENSQIECSFNIRAGDIVINDKYILAGLVQACEAIDMQREIFSFLSDERKPEVLIDMLKLYNNCRFLDCMLQTSFFHEEHFQGLLKSKNDTPKLSNEEAKKEDEESSHKDTSAPENNIAQFTSTPTKRKSTTNLNAVLCKKCSQVVSPKSNLNEVVKKEDVENLAEPDTNSIDEMVEQYKTEYKILLGMARSSIIKAFDGNNQTAKNDSGVHSRGENSSTNLTSQASDSKETSENTESEKNTPTLEESLNSIADNPIDFGLDRNSDVCEIFFFLLKDQIGKCRKWIMKTSNTCGDKEKEDDDDEEINEMEEAIEETDLAKENPVTVIGEAILDDGVGCEVAMDEQPLNLNALCETLAQLDSPMASSSPSHKISTTSLVSSEESLFEVLPIAPAAHHFINMKITPTCKAQYQKAVHREYRILQASLPPGMVVRAYEDRMDLLSVMMVGPKGTPYQNALFFFDFQMGKDYPKNPPTCLYVSYCTERLNPNLYEEGKVCVSLLGTWSGRDTEMWTSGSTILQVLVSIQGLILVDEPYYNEAGYEKQRGTQLGMENSRVYNEMAIIKIAHSTVKQLQRPPHIFKKEMIEHFTKYGKEIHGRMQAWADYSSQAQRLKVLSTKDMPKEYQEICELPEFPLLPCSRGFCIAIKGVLAQLQEELAIICNKDKLLTTEFNATEAVAGTAPRAAPEEV